MSQVNDVQIKCLKESCGRWFSSPFLSDDTNPIDTLVGNTAQCPSCGAMTPCKSENMRVSQGHGFAGSEI